MVASLLLLILLIPLIVSAIIPFFRNMPNIRELVSILGGITNTLLIGYIIITVNVNDYGAISVTLIHINDHVNMAISLEKLGILFALLINFLWIVTIVYSIGYMRKNEEDNQTRFFTFFAMAICAATGVALSKNLWSVFLFYEMLTFSTFPLVGHNINKSNKKQVFTYLNVLVLSSILLFFTAIILTFLYSGTTEFIAGGVFKQTNIHPLLIIILLLLFIFGVAKTAIMPLHRWLPAAMVAPAPVSALLHAVAVVKSGVFIIIKIVVYIFGTEYLDVIIHGLFTFNWLIIIPAITIIWASIIALFQDNLKTRLAYSTISQLSYVLLGVLLLAPYSILGAMLQVFAHAFGKITLFFATGAIITLANKENVSELSGIGVKMPITMIAFAIGAASIVGMPLTFGFLAKWFIVKGSLDISNYFSIIVIIVSTLLNSLYLFPIIFKAFFKKDINSSIDIGHSSNAAISTTSVGKSLFMDVALIITAFATVALNIYGFMIINFLAQ